MLFTGLIFAILCVAVLIHGRARTGVQPERRRPPAAAHQ